MFVRRGSLMAQRFDAQRARLSGEAVPIAEGVDDFATSLNGAVVYRSNPLNVPTQLTWADRSGHQLGTVGSPGLYRNPELSPDGLSVVMGVIDAQSGSSDIWRLELARGVMNRLTSDPGNECFPIWSPDGTWIMFASNRAGGVPQLYRVLADGRAAKSEYLDPRPACSRKAGHRMAVSWSIRADQLSNCGYCRRRKEVFPVPSTTR